jgi:hypothetical protein
LDIDVAVTPVGNNGGCSNEKRKLTDDNELNKELKKVSEFFSNLVLFTQCSAAAVLVARFSL